MERRRFSFATRLFILLFLLSAVPSVALLGLATWGLRNYVELARGAGPWSRVGETGAGRLAALDSTVADSVVQVAAEDHEAELSRSVGLARRWDLIAQRLVAALPWAALVLGVSLALVAIWSARQLARGLSRPVNEVVDWAGRLSREEPLPEAGRSAEREPPEFSVLREAFRSMAVRLEEGRRQELEAERLRAATEMSRRVAHEIKNPLTPLMLALRQARMFTAQGKVNQLEDPLQVSADEAERLDEMARTFSQLGRLPEGPTSEIDLAEMLGALLASDLPETIRGTLDAEEGVPLVDGHLEALSRAFRNLLGNAVEALTDRADSRIDVSLTMRNDTVEIAIADNGPGIAEEDSTRLWDQDFTTKKRGTGLGLALVRQTVRAHGGDVFLRDMEEGTCFVVLLPVKQDNAA